MLSIPMIINFAANALNAGANAWTLNANRKRRKENKAINERLDKLENSHKTDIGNIQKDMTEINSKMDASMKELNDKINNISTCTNGMAYDLNKLQSDTAILQGRLDVLSQSQVQQSQVQQPQTQDQSQSK